MCSATAADAVLNVGVLKKALKRGDLRIQSGGAAQDIVFATELAWTTASRLTLDAQDAITFAKPMTAHVAGDPSGYHALAANIDADKDGPYEGAAVTTGFRGVFDGLGHTIANFHVYVHRYHHYLYAGLFLKVGGAEIRNLDMTGCTGATEDQSDWGDNARKRKFPILGLGPVAGSVESSLGRNCSASGLIQLYNSDNGGGLVGAASLSTINHSHASTQVAGYQGIVGGLVATTVATTVRGSYANGAVSTVGAAGGLVGAADGVIGNDVNGTKGRPRGTNTNAYWTLDSSGISDLGQGAGNIANDPGLTGLSTAQLQSGLPAGFDPALWGESAGINDGAPYLLANPPPQ